MNQKVDVTQEQRIKESPEGTDFSFYLYMNPRLSKTAVSPQLAPHLHQVCGLCVSILHAY